MAKWKMPRNLSIIIAALAAAVSAGGLFFPQLYRDNALITCAWRGNDLITLAVAVPGLIAAMVMTVRGSLKAQLIWAGMLGYMVYNYMFYLYGAVFNVFFLPYVLLFTLSVYALILTMTKLDIPALHSQFSKRTPTRWIGGFMLFFAALLGMMWVAMSASFIFTGIVPQPIVQTDHPTGVVFATDLALLIPAMGVGGVLLIRRRPFGFVLSAIMLIKACTYGLVMIVMSAFVYFSLGTVDSMIPLWVFLSAGCLAACVLLFYNMKSAHVGKRANHAGMTIE